MNIACVGWGSLISDPGSLKLRSPWFDDGPLLPVEYARHSKNDRVTLVIVPGFECSRTLWALLEATNPSQARAELAAREGITSRTHTDIGFWTPTAGSHGQLAETVGNWAASKQLDAVVWTALPPKWNGKEGVVPSCDDVLAFLRQQGNDSEAARYIRATPPQVRTPYRRIIEPVLGWTPPGA